MKIALDYDDTFTTDPELWRNFAASAIRRGHQVICVTMRFQHESTDMDNWLRANVPIVFTGRKAKKPFLERTGIRIDVWIDDRPEWILNDAGPSS